MVLELYLIPFFKYIMSNIDRELTVDEELIKFFEAGENKIESINTEDNHILPIWLNNSVLKKLLNWNFFLSFLLSCAFISIILTKFYEQIDKYIAVEKVFVYLRWFVLISLFLIILRLLFSLIRGLSKNPIKDFSRYNYGNFHQIIENLGQNKNHKELKKQEISLKIEISKRESEKEKLRLLSPSIALLIVIFIVTSLGVPNEQLELQLYGVISWGGLGIVFATFILQLIIRSSIQDISIYKESLIILEEALIIAKEQENSNHSKHQSDTVVLSKVEYQEIIEELEELDDLRAYTKAIRANDEAIPFEQAIAEIEQNRQ